MKNKKSITQLQNNNKVEVLQGKKQKTIKGGYIVILDIIGG